MCDAGARRWPQLAGENLATPRVNIRYKEAQKDAQSTIRASGRRSPGVNFGPVYLSIVQSLAYCRSACRVSLRPWVHTTRTALHRLVHPHWHPISRTGKRLPDITCVFGEPCYTNVPPEYAALVNMPGILSGAKALRDRLRALARKHADANQ